MDSIDILETINYISISISNLRFCDTLDTLNTACRCIQIDLQSIGPYIADPLYTLLDTELREVFSEQLVKFKGDQA